MPTQKNSASWDLHLGFNLAFKRLKYKVYITNPDTQNILKERLQKVMVSILLADLLGGMNTILLLLLFIPCIMIQLHALL
jgi:hypothetical protein